MTQQWRQRQEACLQFTRTKSWYISKHMCAKKPHIFLDPFTSDKAVICLTFRGKPSIKHTAHVLLEKNDIKITTHVTGNKIIRVRRISVVRLDYGFKRTAHVHVAIAIIILHRKYKKLN